MSSKNGSPTFDIIRPATLWICGRQVSLQTLGLSGAHADTPLRSTRRRISTVKNREWVQTRSPGNEQLVCAHKDEQAGDVELADSRRAHPKLATGPESDMETLGLSKKCQASSIFFCREITRLVLLNRARFGIPVSPCSWRNTTERTFPLFAIPFGQPLPIPSALNLLAAT